MENIQASLCMAGNYVFELRMASSTACSLMAQSSPFTVTQAANGPVAPTNLVANWTNESNRDYLVQWSHTGSANSAQCNQGTL